jgi:hypothetical protein
MCKVLDAHLGLVDFELIGGSRSRWVVCER